MPLKFDTCKPSDIASYIKTYQNHLLISFCYNVKHKNTSKSNLVTYSDVNKPMIITKEQETEFEKENNCHIYEKSLTDLPPIKVKKKRILNEIKDLQEFMKNFFSSSLEKLANTLKPYQFKELSKHYPEQLDLIKVKITYPYEYMDSPKKYDKESLPNIDKLYTSLQLDPVHYYSTPGFAWNAMLRKKGVELELLSVIDMYLMFEQGIRGGLFQVLDILRQEKGYIFEVDLKYPEKLHDLHSDYPLAPKNVFDNEELPKFTT
ncbi:Hypothetical protein CINCED_3A004944 [Cinara cedri]|uniref:Uncharacterized protein n=1 Tax=Cinara cedri TaxID=506608 RepID=A0A5E4MSD7_9HEMI|nr:Hypothetical protein CINCED_3A004944 [Cinara cedri]